MIPIIHRHSDFIVINKPSGINMHQTTGDNQKLLGIVDLLCIQENLERLYLVHRLDTATSGTMVLARNKTTAQSLNSQFLDHQIKKYYLALLSKKPKKKQGKIQGIMSKTRNGSYKLNPNLKDSVKDTNGSQPSVNSAVTLFVTQALPEGLTHVKTDEQSYTSDSYPTRLAIVKPLTGKTHQIRVAFKALGAPIFGDTRYKGSTADRLYLHSMFLSFSFAGELYEFQTLPDSGAFFNQKLFSTLPNLKEINWPSHTFPKN